MKKKLILAVIEIFVTVSLFAEYLGNKPSIDFTVSPAIFLAFEKNILVQTLNHSLVVVRMEIF